MSELPTDILSKQIEELRNQLHTKVKDNNISSSQKKLTDHDLLQLSKRLDELILKYMKLAKKTI